MNSDLLFSVLVLGGTYLVYLWINEPKYKDCKYVPVRKRILSVLKRVVGIGD